MLEVLKKKKLKDTVVVVTRYYGGIKLGAGGLIRAYGKAVSEGLTKTGIVERKLKRLVKITLDYSNLGKIENELRLNNDYDLLDIIYNENVEVKVSIDTKDEEKFVVYITDLLNGKLVISLGEVIYFESNVNF